MENNNQKALKSGVWYIFANMAVKAMALLTTPIFTRLLTHEQFGEYSTYTSWTNIAIIIITMKMEASLISAKFDFKGNFSQYILSLLGLTAISTAVWSLVINFFSDFFCDLFETRLLYVNLMLIYCFFYAVVNIFQISERYFYRYKRSVFVAVFVAITTTLVSILLVMNMQNRLTGRVVGGVIPTVAIGMMLLLTFFKEGKKISISYWPYALKICLPYIPHLLSLQVLNSVDRIMITKICGMNDTALYSIAYTCGNIATLLMTSMNNAFSPWLGDNLNAERYKEIRRISIYYIMAFSFMAVGVMLLAPEVLLVMGGESYSSAKFVMPPVAMGCVCQFLYTLFVNIEQYKKKTIGMALASGVAALLNYLLNLLFIPKFGYIAAAYTTLAGYMFLLIIHMILVKRIGYDKAYSYKFIIILIMIMTLITIGINYTYRGIYLRYSTIVLYGMAVIVLATINRKKLQLLIKKIIK